MVTLPTNSPGYQHFSFLKHSLNVFLDLSRGHPRVISLNLHHGLADKFLRAFTFLLADDELLPNLLDIYVVGFDPDGKPLLPIPKKNQSY